MLTLPLAHQAAPASADELWTRWSFDPLLLVGLGVVAWLYLRGSAARRTPAGTLRPLAFWLGLGTVVLALVSPLAALAGALASAHMAQHGLLIVVAAPLLALAAPAPTLLKGTPLAFRRLAGRALRRAGLPSPAAALRYPAAVALLHVGGVWVWHAARPYDAALRHGVLHVLEHATFFFTALLFWIVVAGARRRAVSRGHGVLLVFAVAMQGVLLGVLLTFAPAPWYGYSSTSAFGLDPLTDQQLAGLIMWIPAGLVYVAAALALLAAWLAEAEREGALEPAEPRRRPRGATRV